MALLEIYSVLVCLFMISVSQLSLCSIYTRAQTERDIVFMKNELSNNLKSQLTKKQFGGTHHLQTANIPGEAIRRRRWRRSPDDSLNALCSSARVNIQKKLDDEDVKTKLISSNLIDANNNQSNLLLMWSGLNTGVLIVVTSNTRHILQPSTVYRSTDNGRSFKNINAVINPDKDQLFIPNSGFRKHTLDSTKLFIVENINFNSKIYVSQDSGATWKGVLSKFDLSGQFVFHPTKKDSILCLSQHYKRMLYMSEDGGFNWIELRPHVFEFSWSETDDNIVYATVHDKETDYTKPYKMVKLDIKTKKSRRVLDDVHSFGNNKKFLYASVYLNDDKLKRMIMVSIDEAKTWIEAQVPQLTNDRFFSVLDISEDLIFLHVDNPGDTGHGTLYTSGARGIMYSESLLHHLYPNTFNGDTTDFYKVLSMDGVYLASKILENKNIVTVISYDRGAEWKNIPKPKNSDCSKGTCFLQVYNSYSASQRVKGFPPVSLANAPGLIIVHGHVGDSLQTTDTDVFISNDGGYSFFLALKGPHLIQIGDHGGLIVALPLEEGTKTLKFSTDEGNCFIDFVFTDKDIKVTGLLTEPGNKAMSVSIWGFKKDTHEWIVIVVDFDAVINKKCSESDYEKFIPHKNNKLNGCYLGLKKTLKKLKKESICKNGYGYELEVKESTVCKCDKSDYECDYGYERKGTDDKCKISPKLKDDNLFICERGHIEKIVSEGYRLIPGNKCQGGFKPDSRKIDTSKLCGNNEESKIILKKKVFVSAGKIAFYVIFVLIITLAIIAFLWRRYYYRKADTVILYSKLREDNGKGISIWADDAEDEPNIYENDNLKSKETVKNDPSTLKSFHDDSDVDMLE